MSRWTHKSGDGDHPVDPTYNGNNIPSWWSCHKCSGTVLLDGRSVPIVTPPKGKVTATSEPPLSAQP